jgi:hypothetical protein
MPHLMARIAGVQESIRLDKSRPARFDIGTLVQPVHLNDWDIVLIGNLGFETIYKIYDQDNHAAAADWLFDSLTPMFSCSRKALSR